MNNPPAPYHGAITLKSLLENPDLLNPPQLRDDNKEKKLNDDLPFISRTSNAAYLGANLWDNTISFGDPDNFKFEFMDLDEFLLENETVVNPDNLVPTDQPLEVEVDKEQPTSLPTSPTSSPVSPNVNIIVEKIPIIRSEDLQLSPGSAQLHPASPAQQDAAAKPSPSKIDGKASPPPSVDFQVNIQDVVLSTIPEFIPGSEDIKLSSIPGEAEYDPRKRQFSEEELKPQPMIKKSKKIFVPDDAKDDRYWCRRRKNNVAAKRSRDARRIKENQIAMRASFLEQQNNVLKAEYDNIKVENKALKARLAKYEKV